MTDPRDDLAEVLLSLFLLGLMWFAGYKKGGKDAVDEVTKNRLHCSSELTNQGVKNEN